MSLDSESQLSLAERLALDPCLRREFLDSLTDDEARALQHDWSFWGRPKQQEPPGDWWYWLILAGRGFGKSRTGGEWVNLRAQRGSKRIALVAETAADARDVMVEGPSGVLACAPPWNKAKYEPSKRRVTWENGCVGITYSAETPDQLRGPEHDTAWCFIAGTSVLTADGNRPVESLRAGDHVWTRSGLKRVSFTSARKCQVGTVRFSNGSELTGTADHPVLTLNGWTSLSDLSLGAVVCVTSASSGAASDGIATAASITSSEAPEASAVKTETCCTERSTANTTDQSRLGTKCTIETAISTTTTPAISSVFQRASTRRCIALKSLFGALIGMRCLWSLCLAWIAARMCRENAETVESPFVCAVRRFARICAERPSGSAQTAKQCSAAYAATFAASVASTWEAVGPATVYNIQVEDAPEYFANGVLVHNCDELAKWKYPDAWDQLLFGMRTPNQTPRVLVTTTPRPTPIIKMLIADKNTHVTRGSTFENRSNLAAAFIAKIQDKYGNTRLGRQELFAEVLDDAPGALWKRDEMIEKHRVTMAPAMRRIAVAVDPSVSSSSETACTGIVVAGVGHDGHAYVFDDVSVERPTPDQWANAAITAFNVREADCIVGEVNNGGDLVESNLAAKQKNLPIIKVRASRGKDIRAEPISSLYQQGKVHHVGMFAKLEDEMCQWEPGVSAWSPNRLDALVWALTELMLGAEVDDASVFRVKSNRGR